EYNERAKTQPEVPPITLCTGRPQPYVEAIMKFIGAEWPAICENGGLLYQLKGNRYLYDPRFQAQWRAKLSELREQIDPVLLKKFHTDFQPGKETHLTLIAETHEGILAVSEEIKTRLQIHLKNFQLSISENCLNIVPDSFDKGSGLKWLARVTEVPLENMAAVGDSEGDLPFMKLAGFSACPANATPEVKASVRYVSNFSYTLGLIDIIEKCISLNLEVL
ncbi:MAG: HAD-IIB family hydrolase, partial [candidate division KSB1 bacterium]|nr:HAD-IIB family hydrolase [candidate division KSB1 bacterium]